MSAPDISELVALLTEKLAGRWRFVGGPFDDARLVVSGAPAEERSSELLLEVTDVSIASEIPEILARAVPYRDVRDRRLAGERPRLLSTLVIPAVDGGLVYDRRSEREGVVTHYRGAFHLLGGGANPPPGGRSGGEWLRREARRETEEETDTTLPDDAISRQFWLTEEPTTGYLQACFGAVAACAPSPDPKREGEPFLVPLDTIDDWLLTSWPNWVPSGLASVLLDLVLRRGIPVARALSVAHTIDEGNLRAP